MDWLNDMWESLGSGGSVKCLRLSRPSVIQKKGDDWESTGRLVGTSCGFQWPLGNQIMLLTPPEENSSASERLCLPLPETVRARTTAGKTTCFFGVVSECKVHEVSGWHGYGWRVAWLIIEDIGVPAFLPKWQCVNKRGSDRQPEADLWNWAQWIWCGIPPLNVLEREPR